MTTIVIVDDHQTLVDLIGLALSAESDLEVVGTAVTAADGLRVIERTGPDLVLLDVGLPDGDGLAVAAELVRLQPAIRVVIFTASLDVSLIGRAAAAGACAVVAKTGSFSEVLSSIRTARNGTMLIDATAREHLVRSAKGMTDVRHSEQAVPALTPREQEVLDLLAAGRDLREIARTMTISHHTCRGYVKSILSKLDAHSQLEAVVTAGRRGLLRRRP